MSPSGLPGLFVVLFVVFGFATLFVSRHVAGILLWVMQGMVLLACGFGAYRWQSSRGITVTSGSRSMSLSRCLALLAASFAVAVALEWVADRIGVPATFRVLGVALGWPGFV